LTCADPDEGTQRFESRHLATGSVLFAQTVYRPSQQSHCPTSVENFLGGQMIGRFYPVTILCILRVENNKFKVPATFERAGAICLVRQEVPERGEQKRSKLTFQWKIFPLPSVSSACTDDWPFTRY
jgi:hypothetical protein